MNTRLVKVNWEGSLFVHHSLGMVNRELLRELVQVDGLDIRHVPYEADQFVGETDPRFTNMIAQVRKPPHSAPDIYIRHRWPPDLNRPAAGRHIQFQPWEYGSAPVEWVKSLGSMVDEVWTPGNFVKNCYVRSGMDPQKVHVVIQGVDPAVFHPGVQPLQWLRETAGSKFCFLFNGGATLRKGIDILANAYLNEFKPDEQVCLIVKDSNAYGKELSKKIQALSLRTDAAKIIYTDKDLAPEQLPMLYASADCYVQPYRAEGFCLPVAEAMACGLPVIVTGGGSCMDFTDEHSAYHIQCKPEVFPEKQVSGIETAGNPFWLVPDMQHLRSLLRHVFEHRSEAAVKGRNASVKISSSFTWHKGAAGITDRFRHI